MAESESATSSSLSLHVVPDPSEADGEMESKGSEARATSERCVLEDFTQCSKSHLWTLFFKIQTVRDSSLALNLLKQRRRRWRSDL